MGDYGETASGRRYLETLESRRARREWLIWAALFLAVAVAGVPLFFFGDLQANSKILTIVFYALQGAIFIGALARSFLEIRSIDRELGWAKQNVAILSRVDGVQDFLDSAEAKEGAFLNHIKHLHTISRRHHQIEQDALIEVMQSRLQAKNRTVEVWSGILVTVGLLGTIVGLIFMLDSMAAIMQNQGANGDVVKELFAPGRGPMAGLGFAFYTTLLGAFLGGVILRVLTVIVDESITHLIATVAELTEVYVLPLLRKEAETAL